MKKTLKYKNRKRKTQKGGSWKGLRPGSGSRPMSNRITLRRRSRVNKNSTSNPSNPNIPVTRRSYNNKFNLSKASTVQLPNFVATSPYLNLKNTGTSNLYTPSENFLNHPKILKIKKSLTKESPTSHFLVNTTVNLYSEAINYDKQNYAEVSPHIEEYIHNSTLSKTNSGATLERSKSLKKRIINEVKAQTKVSPKSINAQNEVLSELEKKLQKHRKN